MFDLRTAFDWLPQAVMIGRGDEWFGGVSTDTRSVRPGDLFVALRGDRFDGHRFVDDAMAAGAAGVLVEEHPLRAGVPALVVPCTRRALGVLAQSWRRRFRLPVVAVTGSNGKTTVKEMIAAILAAHVGPEATLSTQGNLNNEIGVPQTIFRLRPTHRMAVLELGMNHPDEIPALAVMVQPTVALVLNAQREHQEFMDGPEATARENGTVFIELPADGVAVYPGDDPCTPIWRDSRHDQPVMEFGLVEDLACSPHAASALKDARPERFTARIGAEQLDIRLNIAGRHNVRNALAAATCASALGIPPATIVAGLAAFRPVAGRLCRHRLPSRFAARDCPVAEASDHVVLIDDTYNANPDSMRAAIDVLADEAGPRLIVMGDMGETGVQAEAFHREVGQYARERGMEAIWTVGRDMKTAAESAGANARHWASVEDLLADHPVLPDGVASVLIKGSRFMRMERIVKAWSSGAGTDLEPVAVKPASAAGDL
ncbi:MAG: UDP-N-acetylmuramoyl-tripeptide--D-alanyl-D-alanine ligase [Lautropia sp.]|nr:UDP-N-acetylmuramoyl-tripeptide--D-alanyl-D-alanine ligase [Lautropia sp.]